jgi:hypothetical protein
VRDIGLGKFLPYTNANGFVGLATREGMVHQLDQDFGVR